MRKTIVIGALVVGLGAIVTIASTGPAARERAANVDKRVVTFARLQILELGLVAFKERRLRYPTEQEDIEILAEGPDPIFQANPRPKDFAFDGWGSRFV
jgi:hypothetical protein